MATVAIKIDNKIKMDRGHMNLRTAHQEQFISSSRRKIERGEGASHPPCTLKNSRPSVVVFPKSVFMTSQYSKDKTG